MLTYKRKLRLNKAQEARIGSWIGTCRFVYNMGLEIRREAWKNKQQQVHKYELMKQLKPIKNIEWIKDVPHQCLEKVIVRLDNAYKSFFKGAGFPKWATKGQFNSIQFKQDAFDCIRATNTSVRLPKIGKLKIIKDTEIIGKIKNASIIKEPTGYFVCITTDAKKSIHSQNESQILGLDMGVRYFAVDSNGVKFENPKHFKTFEAKLRIENRSLARKKKGSNSWKRQLKKVALLNHKIANIRKDFLHKLSTQIAKNNHTVILEDLNIKGMVKSRLSKSISDCGWGIFRLMLEYKTNVVAVNPKHTSQTCNDCGAKDAKSRISQSKFVCTACGVESNADENAAKNILRKGIPFIRQREAIACA